jgi:hypothetical protein
VKTQKELIDAMRVISDEAYESGFSFCAALTTRDGTPSATIFCGEPLGEPLRVLRLTALIEDKVTEYFRAENP